VGKRGSSRWRGYRLDRRGGRGPGGLSEPLISSFQCKHELTRRDLILDLEWRAERLLTKRSWTQRGEGPTARPQRLLAKIRDWS
jgi:hypothetical protein